MKCETAVISSKGRLFDGSHLVNKTWGAVKIAGSTIKSTTQQAAALATNQIRKRPAKDQRKIEKQISDEIHKIFDESDSFYYCLDIDFTNNLQRKSSPQCDDRFFWNKFMLKDVMELNVIRCRIDCLFTPNVLIFLKNSISLG